MAHSNTTEVFNCSPEQFWKIVADYEKYPEFLQEVKSVRVVKDEGSRKLVEFQVSLIKTFTYSLWMSEKAPDEIRWELASSDLFKVSNGRWNLTNEAGKTRASYDIEATFNIFVPGPISKALINVHLPNMMAAYHARVNKMYGQN